MVLGTVALSQPRALRTQLSNLPQCLLEIGCQFEVSVGGLRLQGRGLGRLFRENNIDVGIKGT